MFLLNSVYSNILKSYYLPIKNYIWRLSTANNVLAVVFKVQWDLSHKGFIRRARKGCSMTGNNHNFLLVLNQMSKCGFYVALCLACLWVSKSPTPLSSEMRLKYHLGVVSSCSSFQVCPPVILPSLPHPLSPPPTPASLTLSHHPHPLTLAVPCRWLEISI